MAELAKAGLKDTPVIVGGIIPPEDEAALRKSGIAGVYTPKDFNLNAIMGDMLGLAARDS